MLGRHTVVFLAAGTVESSGQTGVSPDAPIKWRCWEYEGREVLQTKRSMPRCTNNVDMRGDQGRADLYPCCRSSGKKGTKQEYPLMQQQGGDAGRSKEEMFYTQQGEMPSMEKSQQTKRSMP